MTILVIDKDEELVGDDGGSEELVGDDGGDMLPELEYDGCLISP
jgi:hypothetical protein